MSGFLCSMVGVSSAAAAVVNNAVSFDGTGDFYQVTGLTTTATDNGKILVAGTIYWAGGNNLQQVVNVRLGTGGSDHGFWIWINGGRMQIKIVTGDGSVPTSMYEDAENSLTQNAYNQFVIYLDTSSWTTNSKIYVNGVSKAKSNEGTSAYTFNWGNTATTIKVGQKNTSQTGDGTDFNGRISQLWISNPATLPDISNFWNTTSNLPIDLGTNGTASGLAQPLIYHYGDTTTFPTNNGTGFNAYTLTATGDVASAEGPTYGRKTVTVGRDSTGATISTTQSKFGGASLRVSFSSSSWDYLQITSPSSLLNFGSNDWTVEGWFRFDNTNTDAALWSGGTGTGDFDIRRTNDNLLRIGRVNTAWDVISGSTGIAANTWYHLAFVKSGGTARIYVDGTEVGSASNAISYSIATQVRIGAHSADSLGLAGYIDDLRVSKTARYTAGFTAPAAAFVNDANTLLLLHMNGTDGSTTFTDDAG